MTLRLGRGSPWGLGQGSKGVSVFFRPPSSSSGACKASLSSFGILSPFYRRVCLFVPLPLLLPSSLSPPDTYIFLRFLSPGATASASKQHRPIFPSPLPSRRVPIVFQFSTHLSLFLSPSIDRKIEEEQTNEQGEKREKGEFFLSTDISTCQHRS